MTELLKLFRDSKEQYKPKKLPKKLQVLNSVLELVKIKERIVYVPKKENDSEHFELVFKVSEVVLVFTMQGNFDYICNYKQ